MDRRLLDLRATPNPVDHDPNSMGDLCRHLVEVERGDQADCGAGSPGAYLSQIGMACRFMIWHGVDTARATDNFAAVEEPLQYAAVHTDGRQITRAYHTPALYVL